MNQYKTFIALGLSSLFGINILYAGEAQETANGIVFTSGGSTYSQNYSVTSGEKNIVLSKGMQSATMQGINVENSAILNIDFYGRDPNSYGESQMQWLQLNNGSKITASDGAIVNFRFHSIDAGVAQYDISGNRLSSDKILFDNRGTLNFYLGDMTTTYVATNSLGKIKNLGTTNFIFGNNVNLINSSLELIGGDYCFEMSNVKYANVLGATFSNKSQDNQGALIFNLNNAIGVRIDLRDGGYFVNNQQFFSSIKDKPEVILNLKGNSSVYVDFGGRKSVGADHETENTKISYTNQGNHAFLNNSNDYEFIRWIEATPGNYLSFTQSQYDFANNYFSFAEIGEYGKTNMGLSGNGLNFIVAINPLATESYLEYKKTSNIFSDKFIIHSGSEGIHNIGATLKAGVPLSSLSLVQYHNKPEAQEGEYLGDTSVANNILIASVAKSSNITLNPIQDSIVGFNLVSIGFVEVDTDESGIHHGDSQDTYTSYFLSGAKDLGVSVVNQEITTTALALNYDLFIGNFNSLNKRMGDLRNNPYNQGAWGRIFNGQISNDFTSSKNNYTTIQLGYDHKLGNFENASNYLGVAIDYSFAFSESSINASNALQSRTIQDVYSNAFEVAIYNSYIQDEGWFSDSIAKFSYLDSSFNIADNLANTSENQNTSNVAFTLSEEFGYRFKLGENKTWFVDPQLEVAMGYFSGTDLKQVAGSYFLDAKSDGMFMTRARLGASAGYDFKDFTQGKDFKAVVYAGLSCEADLLSGGDVTLTPSSGQGDIVNSLYSSDFRGVLNIGTNVEIRENIRVYADIQTSFGGKISNDYQINLGARFSFGEKGESNMLVEKKNAQ